MSDPKLSAPKELARKTRRWWLRWPSFRVSAGILFFCLALLVMWIVVDSQFRTAFFFWQIGIGVIRVEDVVDPAVFVFDAWDPIWEGVTKWEYLGSRLFLFTVLTIVSVISAATVLIRAVISWRKPGRRQRLLVVVSLLAAWAAVFVGYDQLIWWSGQHQARSALPRFETAATELRRKWPTEKGSLPEAGDYLAPKQYPSVLLLISDKGNTCHETFGYQVESTEHGGLRFMLNGNCDCNLEYHTPGHRPQSYKGWAGQTSAVRRVVELKPNWYLVQYE